MHNGTLERWSVVLWFIIRTLIVCLLCSQYVLADDEPTKIGKLRDNAPIRADRDSPVNFDVWLETNRGNEKWSGSVEVFMENKPAIQYDPTHFKLKLGQVQSVKATIRKSYSGLTVIYAYTRDNLWEPINEPVDLGFSSRLKTNITEPIDGGEAKDFVIGFVDKDGNPSQLDAVVKLAIQTSSTLLVEDPADHVWKQRVDLDVGMQRTAADPVRLKSETWGGDTGLVSLQISTSQAYALHEEQVWVTVRPRWYLSLAVAMLGGLVFSIYQLLNLILNPGNPKRPVIVTLIIGSIAGALAYFLAKWGILGIKVDTGSVQGFFVLGFLFAYTGIDLILKAATSRDGGDASPKDRREIHSSNHRTDPVVESRQEADHDETPTRPSDLPSSRA